MPLLGFRSTPGLPDVLPFRAPFARRSAVNLPAEPLTKSPEPAGAPLDYIAAFDRVRVVDREKRGRTTVVFDELSVIFPKGRRLAIFGGQRSGKSTLINLILGVRTPNRGRVVRNGTISWPLTRPAAFDFSLSLRDNCVFLGQIYRLDIGDLVDFMAWMCKMPDRKMSAPMNSLDSATFRRAGVSACIAVDFDCYLIDDFLTYNAVGFPKQIEDQITEFFRRKSLVFTTRIPGQAFNLCDSAAVLRGGRLLFYDNVKIAAADFLNDSGATATVQDTSDDEGGERESGTPVLGGELGLL